MRRPSGRKPMNRSRRPAVDAIAAYKTEQLEVHTLQSYH